MSTAKPERFSGNRGAHAPSRVLTGAPAGQPEGQTSHQTVTDSKVAQSSAGAPTTAREGACAPHFNCIVTAKAEEGGRISRRADAWPEQRDSFASKRRPQSQKCMPTVNITAWLTKSYLPLAFCPVDDARGVKGGMLPVTVCDGA